MATQSFKIQLDGVELTKAQADGLQRAINTAATSFLAQGGVKSLPKESIWGGKMPEWRGYVLRLFNNKDMLKRMPEFKALKAVGV
jgi:hypothetical protein